MELKVGDRVVYQWRYGLKTGHIEKIIYSNDVRGIDYYVMDNYAGYIRFNEVLKYPEGCNYYEDDIRKKKKYKRKKYNYLFMNFKKNSWIKLKSLKFDETDRFDLSLKLQEEFSEIRDWRNHLYVLTEVYDFKLKTYKSVFRNLYFDMNKEKFNIKNTEWVKISDHGEDRKEWDINSLTNFEEMNKYLGKDMKYLLAELKLNYFRYRNGNEELYDYFENLVKLLELEIYYQVKTDLCSTGDEVLV